MLHIDSLKKWIIHQSSYLLNLLLNCTLSLRNNTVLIRVDRHLLIGYPEILWSASIKKIVELKISILSKGDSLLSPIRLIYQGDNLFWTSLVCSSLPICQDISQPMNISLRYLSETCRLIANWRHKLPCQLGTLLLRLQLSGLPHLVALGASTSVTRKTTRCKELWVRIVLIL